MLESATSVPHPQVDLAKGEQRHRSPAAEPTGAIPVIVDADGPGGRPLTLAQSGAILLYLARRPAASCRDRERRAIAQTVADARVTDARRRRRHLRAVGTRPREVPGTSRSSRALLHYLGARCAARGPRMARDEPSIADFALYPIYGCARRSSTPPAGCPICGRWRRLAARPGVARGDAAGRVRSSVAVSAADLDAGQCRRRRRRRALISVNRRPPISTGLCPASSGLPNPGSGPACRGGDIRGGRNSARDDPSPSRA